MKGIHEQAWKPVVNIKVLVVGIVVGGAVKAPESEVDAAMVQNTAYPVDCHIASEISYRHSPKAISGNNV